MGSTASLAQSSAQLITTEITAQQSGLDADKSSQIIQSMCRLPGTCLIGRANICEAYRLITSPQLASSFVVGFSDNSCVG